MEKRIKEREEGDTPAENKFQGKKNIPWRALSNC